ncbi:TM2 domain-containing protein [Streptomyces sp. KLOTTS4A1]|uniref:TM2 domain-containing protein n=1 Tax=Streptomyces sp. KLOTTS4A1 TaxID=3390996 RepID=UPI0039F451B2
MTEQPPQQPNQQPQQPPQSSQQPPQPGYGYPQDAPPPYQGGAPGPYGHPQYAQQPPYGQQPGYPPPAYGAPGSVPPGYPTGDPHAPYGYDPLGRPYSDKSKIVAGVLQLALGTFGIGRFYMGSVGIGVAQVLTCGGFGIWALIDGILILVGNDHTDAEGRVLRG